jgi:hypothetical protein
VGAFVVWSNAEHLHSGIGFVSLLLPKPAPEVADD